MYSRIRRILFVGIVATGMSLTGCRRGGSPGSPGPENASSDLAAARQKLAEAEKAVKAQSQELDRKTLEIDSLKKQVSDMNVLGIQKDSQIAALQKQLDEHRDALIYLDISATQQRGYPAIALDRYKRFITDYPKSPLVADANRAISELTVSVERDGQQRKTLIDPKRREREALKNFQDGISSVEEIGPLLRQRTAAEVIKLLGPPHRTYRNGTEIGYDEKIIDPSTGNKETLVIVFAEDRVVSVRVGYRGREIKL